MKLTEDNVKFNTHFAQKHYKDMKKKIASYDLDADKVERLEEQKCKSCYYLKSGTMSAQAFSSYNCRECGQEGLHHNSDTPKYCKKCAKEHAACVKCGALV